METMIRVRRTATEQEKERRELETPTSEIAECTCPDFCERDHDNE
jgi:hypothetical protein